MAHLFSETPISNRLSAWVLLATVPQNQSAGHFARPKHRNRLRQTAPAGND